MTRPEMELRRIAGFAMLADGFSGAEVARAVGVSHASVSRWRKLKDPASTKATGRPPVLSRDAIQEVIGQRQRRDWTCFTLQAAIHSQFGIRYHEDHCGWLLRRLAEGGDSGDS